MVDSIKNKSNLSTKGFTLIEILFVILIIGIVASVVVINISISSKEKARIASGLSFSDSVRAQLSTYELSWWRFENNANDNWGSMNGNIIGGVSYVSSAGISGGAYNFNGIDGYVNLDGLNFHKDGASWTFSAWIKSPTIRTLFSQGVNGIVPFFVIRGVGAGALNISLTDNSWNSDANITSNAADIFNDKWKHIAITANNADNTIKIYINGIVDNSSTYFPSGFISLSRAAIGAFRRSSTGGFFSGYIDEVQLYNDALVAQQVNRLYVESAPRHGIALK